MTFCGFFQSEVASTENHNEYQIRKTASIFPENRKPIANRWKTRKLQKTPKPKNRSFLLRKPKNRSKKWPKPQNRKPQRPPPYAAFYVLNVT